MPQSPLIRIKTGNEIEVEQLLTEIRLKREQVVEMTLGLEALKLDVRRFEKAYNVRLA
jgi:hypothetical protein